MNLLWREREAFKRAMLTSDDQHIYHAARGLHVPDADHAGGILRCRDH